MKRALWLAASTTAMATAALLPRAAHALALPQSETPESGGPAATSVDATTPRRHADINPYDRDIEITAPLQFNSRILGEIPVLLTRDDRFLVGAQGFVDLIGPLLTPEARAELVGTLGDQPRFRPEDAVPAGIRLDYDPDQLAVLVLKIAPERRSVESLYQTGIAEEPGDPPERFSAYLNVNSTVSRLSQAEGVRKPEFYINGAMRYDNLVFETDVQARRDFLTDDYQVERNYARLVYDQPDQLRRWYLGDLDPETRGRQSFFSLGGIGVVRQRQRFDSFRNNVLSGDRRLVLQEQSTVRVARNGIFQREFTLDPGQYDISNLPLDTGSNDIQIEVQGVSGSRQSFDYQAYLDTIDLEPGDYEYGAYLGFFDEGGFGNPEYTGKPVFTGFWRKAFLNRPAIGVGLQISEDIQNVTGQTQFLLPNSGRIRIDAGLSHGDIGQGYAVTLGYDQIVGGSTGYDTVSFVADYTSKNYGTIGSIDGINPISWNLNAAYTKRISTKLFVTTNASYRKSRSQDMRDSYSITSTANYRFNKQWTLQFGVEYSRIGFPSVFGSSNGSGFGVNVGLIWQPRYDRRAEARYSTLRELGSARLQQSVDNEVGSFGYGLSSTYSDGSTSVGGQVDYVANRFDVNVTHTAYGTDFGSVGDNNITTVRVGTSIAYAGGHVAVGRTINDSFALVYPHETLDGRRVIVGDSLEGGGYVGKSGVLGPALQNNLTAFQNQSVRYDVIDPPLGYDIGDGVKRVRPAYRSGYAIEVGSAAFISAIGTLRGPDGEPFKLVSGILRRTDLAGAKEEPFFTNTVGRFAIAKLEPGAEYSVEFQADGPRRFSFKVPEDNEGLLDLHVITVGRKEGQ